MELKKSLTIVAIVILNLLSLSAQESPKKLRIFDSNQAKNPKWYCSTCKWIKGSNLKPKTQLVKHNGEKWLKISFSGDKGSGRWVINKLNLKVPEGQEAKGLELTIDYPNDDFKKIKIGCHFTGGKIITKTLTLEKGEKTYYFSKAYTRTGNPANWNGLKQLAFFFHSGTPEFHIKQIAVKLFQKKKSRILEIQRIRKTAEILPGRGSTNLTFDANSPVTLKLGYDKDNLYIDSYAKYESIPRSAFKQGDKLGSIWADELIEYFFSSWNDNRKYIQFVCNLNGAVWDSITDYDKTAARVVRRYHDWKLKHSKKQKFENETWINQVVFPLKDLKINPSKQRFMGFQFVQNYTQKERKHYGPVVWNKCKRFPYPVNFGILVFNQKPFGFGKLFPQKVTATNNINNNTVSFEFKIKTEAFAPGKYILRKFIVTPDKEFLKLDSQKVSLGANKTFTITYSDQKNFNGTYSIYAAIENTHGDIRLCAVNIENSTPVKDMFGKVVFCPEPKKIKWMKGFFNAGEHNTISVPAKASARTFKTAEIFSKKLYGFAGNKYRILKGGNNGIVINIVTGLKPEGYHLKITPEKVTISGADEAGLYYGCRKFLQILRQPMKRLDSAPVKCAEIIDWPDLKIRFTNLLHPHHFYKRKLNENRGIDYLIKWIDRYVAGTGQNMVMVQVGPIVKYKRRPEFNAANCFYSLDDLAKLAQFCRDNFIEFVPRWQVGGHANWSLTTVHPELREKGYSKQANVTHPEHNKIVFDCILDLIEATKCKYVNVGGDEWWHKPNKEKPDELLNGKTRAQVFLNFFKQMLAFCKRHNVELLMHEDMLTPHHNGKRYDLYKIIDRFPKEIIILPWSGSNPDRNIQYFIDKGFRVWPNSTGEWFPGNTRRNIGAYGASVYSFNFSLVLTGRAVRNNYVLRVLRGAEYSWNAFHDKLESCNTMLSSGYLTALMEQFAEPYNPSASQVVKTLNISNNLNCDFNKLLLQHESAKYSNSKTAVTLPAGRQDIGNIPMLLNAGARNCVKISKGAYFKIAVNKHFSSLIFLHTVRSTEKYLKQVSRSLFWREWPYGRPAGDYYVNYTDGTKVKIPIRLRESLNFAGIKPLYRCCLDTRFIMPLKDVNNNYLFLYQYEWPNPYPDKKIKNIELTQSVVNFDLLLFALSGRRLRVK